MTDDEINTWIKHLVTIDQYNQINSTILALAKEEAIHQLALLLVASAPESFEKKISLDNDGTHIFDLPSDCLMLKQVWDYNNTALNITGAADNGSGEIRLTVPGHTFLRNDSGFDYTLYFDFGEESGDVATVHSVVGTTEANDTWPIVYIDDDTLDLSGSTFASAYTSGGRMYLERQETYEYPMSRKPSFAEALEDETKYILRQSSIIVDDDQFENDLIILYRYIPTALTELPEKVHPGIYAWTALSLMKIPPSSSMDGKKMFDNSNYETIQKNIKWCSDIWETARRNAMAFDPFKATNNISDRPKLKRWL